MPNFIKTPHLPSGTVSLVMCEENPLLCEALSNYSIEVLQVPPCHMLDKPVSRHPDMQVILTGGSSCIVARNASETLINRLRSNGFQVQLSANPVHKPYPLDVPLNFALVGSYIMGKKNAMDQHLDTFCRTTGKKRIEVSQGYAKCSVCIVSENSIITSDPVICSKGREEGIEVLLIRPGHIRLDGYDTGLFGGTCGKLSNHVMAFWGDVYQHPDGERIAAFLQLYGIQPLCLCDVPLTDVGSILPLKELNGDDFNDSRRV